MAAKRHRAPWLARERLQKSRDYHRYCRSRLGAVTWASQSVTSTRQNADGSTSIVTIRDSVGKPAGNAPRHLRKKRRVQPTCPPQPQAPPLPQQVSQAAVEEDSGDKWDNVIEVSEKLLRAYQSYDGRVHNSPARKKRPAELLSREKPAPLKRRQPQAQRPVKRRCTPRHPENPAASAMVSTDRQAAAAAASAKPTADPGAIAKAVQFLVSAAQLPVANAEPCFSGQPQNGMFCGRALPQKLRNCCPSAQHRQDQDQHCTGGGDLGGGVYAWLWAEEGGLDPCEHRRTGSMLEDGALKLSEPTPQAPPQLIGRGEFLRQLRDASHVRRDASHAMRVPTPPPPKQQQAATQADAAAAAQSKQLGMPEREQVGKSAKLRSSALPAPLHVASRPGAAELAAQRLMYGSHGGGRLGGALQRRQRGSWPAV